MTMKSVSVAVLLALVAFASVSLMRGASYLETPLVGGLPLGNALAALAVSAMAAAAVALSPPRTALHTASVASLVGAVLWLPVSVALAGNPQLNFTGSRGSTWLAITLIVAGGAFFTLLWSLVASAIAKFGRAGAT